MSRALALVDSSGEPRDDENAQSAGTYAPLLETKLYAPRGRASVVTRARLMALLSASEAHKLTLVTAPAGFGKTTLVAGWVADSRIAGHVAWVSLDPSDNEPQVFWSYVVAALQKTHAAIGAEAAALLHASGGASVRVALSSIINEIARLDTDVVLVLDDYHVIDEPQIHGALTFLLDRLPPRMRVVIASRSEPPIGLPRLRARGELTELHGADLRFSLAESSTFLNDIMGLGLSAADVKELDQRTEGWIAGLKLAGLSIKARGGAQRFVETFSGDNRHVADYLVEEVLEAEPQRVRDFLLATSILGRLNAPLCDAVTGEAGSQAVLENLDKRNLFVVALDDRREWYRYHHLFADVLQRQATAKDIDALRVFHARASAWYEDRRVFAEAIRHALAAGDTDRAANLLERRWPEKDRSYESSRWLAHVKALPDTVVRVRPVLSMGYAWALLNSGELEAAEPWLRCVDDALAGDPTRLVVSDRQHFASLDRELSSARIYLTQSRGDIPGTLEHATLALERIPPDDLDARATGIALVALALWGRGELERAHRTFSDALAAMRAAGHELDAVRGMFVLGDLRAAQGRLRDAAAAYTRGLDVANGSSQFAAAETDELHLGLSDIHREWNDLTAAAADLEGIRGGDGTVAHRRNVERWCVTMARLRLARGKAGDALQLLDEAEQHERRDPIPRVRPIPALRARIWIQQGNVDDAVRWAREAKVTMDSEPSYLREFDSLTLARLLIAQRSDLATDVMSFLERLRAAAQTGGRIGSVIEVLVLQSLTQQTLSNVRGAFDPLGEALALAEPEGYLRIFLDEGDRMRELLRTAVTRGLAGAYARRVLAAFDAPAPAVVPPVTHAGAAESGQALTTRELEILRLIASGLRNQAIADHLSISAATVKRHIANAYGKLGANHRVEALTRAAELELL